MNRKYYFAVGNIPAIILLVLLPIWLYKIGGKEQAITVCSFALLFYYLVIHTSVTLYEDVVTIKNGLRKTKLEYCQITKVKKGKYERPFQRSQVFNKAYLVSAKNIKPAGIEYVSFTEAIAGEIVKEIMERKKKYCRPS